MNGFLFTRSFIMIILMNRISPPKKIKNSTNQSLSILLCEKRKIQTPKRFGFLLFGAPFENKVELSSSSSLMVSSFPFTLYTILKSSSLTYIALINVSMIFLFPSCLLTSILRKLCKAILKWSCEKIDDFIFSFAIASPISSHSFSSSPNRCNNVCAAKPFCTAFTIFSISWFLAFYCSSNFGSIVLSVN